jgi:hypothetical protein
MNNTTSNDMMEREFDIIQSVQQLEPPAALYDTILAKAAQQGATVSKKWLASAAAILALILCIEAFVLVQSNDANPKTEVENLVQQEKFQLYE